MKDHKGVVADRPIMIDGNAPCLEVQLLCKYSRSTAYEQFFKEKVILFGQVVWIAARQAGIINLELGAQICKHFSQEETKVVVTDHVEGDNPDFIHSLYTCKRQTSSSRDGSGIIFLRSG